jgi:uncharacterized protein (DUF2235 family)
MPKTIVFCADGTWNGPSEQTGVSAVDQADDSGELTGDKLTNVVKLYSRLAGIPTPETKDLQDEQEKSFDGPTRQVAKYLHGVGDSSNSIMRVLGGMFGVGVIARIVRGYTFISRQYETGDEIHITGFSRGAYTARALAGMIARVGLLDTSRYDVNDKEEAYKRGAAAWYLSKGVTLTGSSRLVGLANEALIFFETLAGKHDLTTRDLIPNVPIKAIGVWDTVGSMGVPLYLRDERIDIFRFTDTSLSDKVECGFHAMAIDEQRADFPVTKWDRRNGVEQTWFVGAHADVGGGYALTESFLSDVTLEWMLTKLSGVGVQFGGSNAGSQLDKYLTQPIHTPWLNPPFDLLEKSSRQPHIEDTFHTTVVQRWKSSNAYRPSALSFITAENIDRLTVES